MRPFRLTPLALVLALPMVAADAPKPEAPKSKLEALGDLALRPIGPAVTSGRISDLAVDAHNPAVWIATAASGGVWKTSNAGATWKPLFDKEGSYSIGCVTLDPANPDVIWIGTGENNSQRSVGFGDGVYRSLDGGKSWQNMGLKTSEHIGRILLDPRDSGVVFVAAQGPLWNAGGERGLYRSKDGGKTWKAVLTVDEDTGVTDVVRDPRNPDLLFAATYQRRRHVWGMIDGGPGSAVWKSVDGGETWRKVTSGLPKEDMGKIGLAVSPVKAGMVFATIEAARKAGGFFRSLDGGETWEKRSDNVSGAAQYYQELMPDPQDPDRIYAMDTWMQVTVDGGKTWKKAGEDLKHVDNHALWIDPANPLHLVNGNDGGVYETFDRCATWTYKANLPITQFYRVAVDTSRPFYSVYGGTQDNNTLGGPSRTLKASGATNEDWFVTCGGDGFWSAVDPTDPGTVYSESQHGGLVRFDRGTGEAVEIQPQSAPGEEPYRWNWDSPLLISRHDHNRVYFAANRLFRSDNRGDAWKPVSPDLTRRLDRGGFKIMGRVWGVDAVARNASTSFYGNIVSLDESPKKEGLLYIGTDDGLLQVSEDGGGQWRSQGKFPGVPEQTYVSCLAASPHAENTVYITFDNHKAGDYKPYALRSKDRGRTWEPVTGNLPARGPVYVLKEDPLREGLLYCGTEFGLYFSLDAGRTWVKSTSLPTIPVKDLVVQEREGDLVLATFGRGFYVLDDLTPLREAREDLLDQPAHLFGLRPALSYVPSTPLGGPTKGFLGEALFTAANPPFGAVFTYHVKSELKTRSKARAAREKEAVKAGAAVKIPSWDELRAEDREQAPQAVITITDAQGRMASRITGPVEAGLQRVAWDLRLPSPEPIELNPPKDRDPWDLGPKGPLAAPGSYTATLAFLVDGVLKDPAGSVTFQVKPLLEGRDHAGRDAFTRAAQRAFMAVTAAAKTLEQAQDRLAHVQKALLEWPGLDPALLVRARALDTEFKDLEMLMNGDRVKAAHNEPAPSSLSAVAGAAATSLWGNTQPPTGTQRQNLAWAEQGLPPWKARFDKAAQALRELEQALDAAGAPYTPGRG